MHQETAAVAAWPTDERLRALQRIIPRARVDDALAQTGRDRTHCQRLPGWFMIALGLFSRDAYRQIFRCLQVFRPGGIPGRSTLCEARKRLGVAPLRALAAQVVALLGRPETPGAFYRGMRTMAIDGFVLNVADTPANERAFGRPGSGRAPGAFPQVRVLALREPGSHVMWKWLIKSLRSAEITMAPSPATLPATGYVAVVGSAFSHPRHRQRRARASGPSAGTHHLQSRLHPDPTLAR
nr:transposase domain-containing protein [Thiorhodococcus minor]